MKNGFANFLDRIKDNDYPETFKLDEISTLEKLEDKYKKAKENLESKMNKKNKYVWTIKLILFAMLIVVIVCIIAEKSRENSNGYFSYGARFWPNIALLVDSLILIPLLVFTIVEEIINQIANWKRRRNTKNKVTLENGDKENDTKDDEIGCENLKDRCQKLVEDLNENYEPMRNRYKRLCNHFVFYYFAALFVFNIFVASLFIDSLFYKTEKILVNKILEVTGCVFMAIFPSVMMALSIMNEIAEDKKFKF
ncbi:hypothetical protein B9Z55_027479 [Caenorhabditis nigoni]|nr:hypothetical protein B9Z55_027479 [Caenorhabditis nigoni]